MTCRGVGAVLLQELMSCWTECAPGQLAAGPELTAVQCMEATLQCVDMLLHQLPSRFPSGNLVSPSLQALHTACTGSAMTVKHLAVLMSFPHPLNHTVIIGGHAQCMTQKMWG